MNEFTPGGFGGPAKEEEPGPPAGGFGASVTPQDEPQDTPAPEE